ncbi:LysE family transporter [Paenibacillus sp. GYB003]|uniref:LysE family transporter n=1 Tax=Paenibacillus sp. GYB003 TaxID=2994392 RepID=UPI002F962150
MSPLYGFLQGFLLSLSLCLDLGLVNAAIMKTGIENGWKPSFAVGFGSCFGDLTYMSLALLGASAVFELPPVRWTLWLAGTAALLYMTFKMIRETWLPKTVAVGAAGGSKRSLLRHWLTGAGLAFASPTSIVWFALVAGPIVAGMNIGEGAGLVCFVAGFFTAGLLWSFAVAIVSSLSGAWAGPGIIRALSFCSALLFMYFAAKVFWNGLQDVLAAVSP